MNIENTTDFSSYLRSLNNGEREQDNQPEYKIVHKIKQGRDNVFYKWYTQRYDNYLFNVLVYYPDFKSITDYFSQGLNKDNGIKEFYVERVIRHLNDGSIADYTDWFQFNHEQEINLASSLDAESEKFFDKLNKQA